MYGRESSFDDDIPMYQCHPHVLCKPAQAQAGLSPGRPVWGAFCNTPCIRIRKGMPAKIMAVYNGDHSSGHPALCIVKAYSHCHSPFRTSLRPMCTTPPCPSPQPYGSCHTLPAIIVKTPNRQTTDTKVGDRDRIVPNKKGRQNVRSEKFEILVRGRNRRFIRLPAY